jgi:Putative transposase/Transposase zinc-binding domain
LRYRDPLKQILTRTQSYWDVDGTRPAVRRAFSLAQLCRTPALGAEVYASENEEKLVYHTCKSSACSSCGYRATVQWLRERWAALPDTSYKGITFTMPDHLWQFFHDNRPLVRALSALAATLIQTSVNVRYGLRVGVIAILHTFNGRLEFNSHVHTMVTAGGLQASGQWVPSVYYDDRALMKAWRASVIKLLREALKAGQLNTGMSFAEVEAILARQEERTWIIKVQSLGSKEHFLRYAGRYVRRPPIAQRRITFIGEQSMTYWTDDKKLDSRVPVQCSLTQFIDRWAQHILDLYQHAVRTFGLFAPRALSLTSPAVFAVLGQKPRPRPKRLPWATSIQRDFGWDPLLGANGHRMKRVRRVAPAVV